MTTTMIILESLETRHSGVTEAVAASYYEAASVSFNKHGPPPASIELMNGTKLVDAKTSWKIPTTAIQRAWANEIDTTEFGAYCVCLAALEVARGLVAISRAETQTGADYYVSDVGSDPDDLEDALRLEVSGLGNGDSSAVLSRVGKKKTQAKAGKSSKPAVVAVVGFAAKLVHIDDVT